MVSPTVLVSKIERQDFVKHVHIIIKISLFQVNLPLIQYSVFIWVHDKSPHMAYLPNIFYLSVVYVLSLLAIQAISLPMIGKIRKDVEEAVVSNLRLQTFVWRDLRKIMKIFQPGQFSNQTSTVVSVTTVLMGHAVAQLVGALRYKPKGRGFDSRWDH
jgi:hypothetical protein